MSADDNDNTAAELPHTEQYNSSCDIEQGIIVSENTDGLRSSWSWAAATSGGTSILTPVTATLPVGDLERVGVEDAAPVPLIKQMADMGSSIAAYLWQRKRMVLVMIQCTKQRLSSPNFRGGNKGES